MTIEAIFSYPEFFSLEEPLYRKYRAFVKQEKISKEEYLVTIECCSFDGKSVIDFLLNRVNLQKLTIYAKTLDKFKNL